MPQPPPPPPSHSDALTTFERGDAVGVFVHQQQRLAPARREESAARIAGRRALLAREPLSDHEINRRARERRHHQLGPRSLRMPLLSLGLLAAGGLLSALGSHGSWLALVLCGHGVALAGLLLGVGVVAARASQHSLPLSDYYHADEQPASRQEIALLLEAGHADAELQQLVQPWWQQPAPIRKQDIALAQRFFQARPR